MTSTLDSTLPPPVGTAPISQPAHQGGAPRRRRRQRGAGHVVAILVGVLLLFPGLGLLAGGGSLAVGHTVATDGDGYFRFTPDTFESDGVAIATIDLGIDDVDDDAAPWAFDFLEVDLRLRVDGAADSNDVFVGIARSADVVDYLDGAAYSDVFEIDDRTPRYDQVAGDATIDPPADQEFWTVSATGTGEQTVEWQARGGRWSVVVMNADGSAGVTADVEIGARSGVVTPVAVGLLLAGGLIVIVAGGLILLGARGRRLPDADPNERPVPNAPTPPPAAGTGAWYPSSPAAPAPPDDVSDDTDDITDVSDADEIPADDGETSPADDDREPSLVG